jgi:hypothetical protein
MRRNEFFSRLAGSGSIFEASPSNSQNMKEQSILDRVRVASPCSARWEDMEGDERTRFCGQCRKNVFNFSAMTSTEVATLLRQTEGRLCGRFYRRTDGRMLTTDCPAGARRRRNRLARFGSAVIAMVTFLFTGCSSRRETPMKTGEVTVSPAMGDVCVPSPSTTNPPLLGKIAVTPTTVSPGPAPTSGEK